MSEAATGGASPTPRTREVAWRVFAHELTSSSLQEKGTGERAPTHVLTPLGARVNRLVTVGQITQVEKRGEESSPLYRARLSDPTGGVSVLAGSYQPRAQAFLAQVRPPARVTVVGKPTLFEAPAAGPIVSIRAETIVPADATEESRWVLETSRLTLQRIELAGRLRADGPPPELTSLLDEGFPRRLVESALAVRGRYPGSDPERFRPGVLRALEGLAGPSPPAPE